MKKFLATLLTASLVASMAACGSNNNVSTETESSAVSTEVSTETSTEAATEESIATEEAAAGETLGQTLLTIFKDELAANPEATAQDLASKIISDEVILFAGDTAVMEEGFLSGFSADITGFEEAVVFCPTIGSIPFMGYVFSLAEDADVEAFVSMLETNANMRWNVCTEAEEMVVEAVGNKVFFVMCPLSLED